MALDPGMQDAAETYLQPNDYWTTATTNQSSDSSWWNQTNWFHKGTQDAEDVRHTPMTTTEAPGNTAVFNRFESRKQLAQDETKVIADQQQQKKRKQMKLSGIGGCRKEVMNQLTDTIVLPLQHPGLFKAIGVPPSNGVIISGTAGSGKSAIINALRQELNVFYQKVDASEVLANSGGPAQISKLFKAAVKEAPSLIFIDQIEMIARAREKDESSAVSSVRAALRLNIDELSKHTKDVFFAEDKEELPKNGDPHKFVVVVGATSFPDKICTTLLRQGRFDRHVEITKPDLPGRLAILQLLAKSSSMKLSANVNLEAVAEKTVGFVGSDLEALCSDAGLRAIRRQLISERATIEEDPDLPKHYTDELRVPKEILPSTTEALAITQEDFIASLETKDLRSGARQDACSIPKVNWEDIGGLDKAKSALIEALEYPLEYPGLFSKFGMSVQKGLMLYGPPGCGKTLLAEAVAAECKAHFINVNISKLMSPYFGQSEQNIRELFERAKQNAPCVLFFDELDALAKARGAGGSGDGVGSRIVTQLLCELDGASTKKSVSNEAVFCIGATNRPDLIDAALLRPGRFDTLTYVGLPSLKSRVAILKALMRDTPLSDDVKANDFGFFDTFASETKGLSGADMSVICNRARKMAITRYLDRVKAEENGQDGGVVADESVCVNDIMESAKGMKPSVTKETLAVYKAFKAGQKPGNDNKAKPKIDVQPTPTVPKKDESISDYDKRAADALKTMLTSLTAPAPQ